MNSCVDKIGAMAVYSAPVDHVVVRYPQGAHICVFLGALFHLARAIARSFAFHLLHDNPLSFRTEISEATTSKQPRFDSGQANMLQQSCRYKAIRFSLTNRPTAIDPIKVLGERQHRQIRQLELETLHVSVDKTIGCGRYVADVTYRPGIAL